ncbi:hypothetical protein TKK_0007798 [Trichogramma kaykai]
MNHQKADSFILKMENIHDMEQLKTECDILSNEMGAVINKQLKVEIKQLAPDEVREYNNYNKAIIVELGKLHKFSMQRGLEKFNFSFLINLLKVKKCGPLKNLNHNHQIIENNNPNQKKDIVHTYSKMKVISKNLKKVEANTTNDAEEEAIHAVTILSEDAKNMRTKFRQLFNIIKEDGLIASSWFNMMFKNFCPICEELNLKLDNLQIKKKKIDNIINIIDHSATMHSKTNEEINEKEELAITNIEIDPPMKNLKKTIQEDKIEDLNVMIYKKKKQVDKEKQNREGLLQKIELESEISKFEKINIEKVGIDELGKLDNLPNTLYSDAKHLHRFINADDDINDEPLKLPWLEKILTFLKLKCKQLKKHLKELELKNTTIVNTIIECAVPNITSKAEINSTMKKTAANSLAKSFLIKNNINKRHRLLT